MWFLGNAWLIPVIPTVSFFLIILFGKRTARWINGGSYIGLAALLSSFVLSVGVAAQWIHRVQDSEGGFEGALVALGRSIIPHVDEHVRPFTEPVVRTWT